jgi:hypothetical protein
MANKTPKQLALLKATNAAKIADRAFHALDANTTSNAQYTAAYDLMISTRAALAALQAAHD